MKRGDKRGLSGIVTSLILIVLVLVAAGIVWAVYNSLISGSADDTEFSSKCLGVSLDVNSLKCEEVTPVTEPKTYECNVNVERSIGSNQNFSGVEVEVNNGVTKFNSESTQNIAVKGVLSVSTSETNFVATEAILRVFFLKEDETRYYCSPPIIYEKP